MLVSFFEKFLIKDSKMLKIYRFLKQMPLKVQETSQYRNNHLIAEFALVFLKQ
jgi:hypothetical protein